MQKNWELTELVTDKSTKVERTCAKKRSLDLKTSTILQLVNLDDLVFHFHVSFLYPTAMSRMDSSYLKI